MFNLFKKKNDTKKSDVPLTLAEIKAKAQEFYLNEHEGESCSLERTDIQVDEISAYELDDKELEHYENFEQTRVMKRPNFDFMDETAGLAKSELSANIELVNESALSNVDTLLSSSSLKLA